MLPLLMKILYPCINKLAATYDKNIHIHASISVQIWNSSVQDRYDALQQKNKNIDDLQYR